MRTLFGREIIHPLPNLPLPNGEGKATASGPIRIPILLILFCSLVACKEKPKPVAVGEAKGPSLIRLHDLLDHTDTKIESHFAVTVDSFEPYQGEGWKIANGSMSAMDRKVVLMLPESQRRPREWRLGFRARASGASPTRTMKVSAQGKELASFSLGRDWNDYKLRIATSDLKRPHVKQLNFAFTHENKAGQPFAEFLVFDMPAYTWGRTKIGGEVRTAIMMLGKSTIKMPVQLPSGKPFLFLGTGIPGRYESPSRALFRVGIQSERQGELLRKQLTSISGWSDHKIDLSAYAGKKVQIELQTVPVSPKEEMQVAWSSPEIYDVSVKSKRPNIILFSVDTLRADRVSYYGHPMKLTPNLDQLAAKSTVFRNAYATYPGTLPSHTSVMTGLYVAQHQVGHATLQVPRTKRISPELTTLAELASAQNYFTAAITDGGFVSSFYGFDQGFQQYADNESTEKAGDNIATINNALKWLETNSERPFLLFLHTYKVHEPFGPPRETFVKLFPDYPLKPEEEPKISMDWLLRVVEGKTVPTEKQKDFVRRCYEAEVHFFDQVFARLLKDLQTRGLDKNTVILVFGDHGEQLFDRGNGFGHGKTVNVEEMKVPLILYIPGQKPQERNDVVSLVDIFPTVAEMTGAKFSHPIEGISLLSPQQSKERNNRSIFYEVTFNEGGQWGIQNHEFKLVLDQGQKKEYFYDIRKDSKETTDISSTSPRAMKIMKDLLGAHINKSLTAASHSKKTEDREESRELREQLKALGYLN